MTVSGERLRVGVWFLFKNEMRALTATAIIPMINLMFLPDRYTEHLQIKPEFVLTKNATYLFFFFFPWY